MAVHSAAKQTASMIDAAGSVVLRCGCAHGLDYDEWALLRWMIESHGISPTIGNFAYDYATPCVDAEQVAAALERRGLISLSSQRDKNGERRIQLTGAGRLKLQADPMLTPSMRLFETFSTPDLEIFGDLICSLIEACIDCGISPPADERRRGAHRRPAMCADDDADLTDARPCIAPGVTALAISQDALDVAQLAASALEAVYDASWDGARGRDDWIALRFIASFDDDSDSALGRARANEIAAISWSAIVKRFAGDGIVTLVQPALALTDQGRRVLKDDPINALERVLLTIFEDEELLRLTVLMNAIIESFDVEANGRRVR